MISSDFLVVAPSVDPTADALTDLGNRLDPSWFLLALLIPLAIVVLWFGNRQFRSWRGVGQLEPRGRPFAEWSSKGDAEWERTRLKLDSEPPAAVARANRGPVRIVGTIVNASGTLGGAPGRECVWRNRVGGRPESAVAADLIVVADDSGRCGIENLERARVIAPSERHSVHHESIGLYLGDRVEISGAFVPERVGDDPDPSRIVYGTIGSAGPIAITVVDRPDRPQATSTAGEPGPRD